MQPINPKSVVKGKITISLLFHHSPVNDTHIKWKGFVAVALNKECQPNLLKCYESFIHFNIILFLHTFTLYTSIENIN